MIIYYPSYLVKYLHKGLFNISGNLPPKSIHIAGWVVFPCIQFNSNFYLIKFASYYSVSTCVLEKIWGLTIVIILISRILPPISIHIARWVVFPYVQTVPVSIHIAWDLSICKIFCKIFCKYFGLYCTLVLDMTLNCLYLFLVFCYIFWRTPFCFSLFFPSLSYGALSLWLVGSHLGLGLHLLFLLIRTNPNQTSLAVSY